MKNGTRSASTNEYTVGWICAISTELTAATAFLDERFDAREYNLPDDDNNDYTLGRIGGHYVAITVLPAYGTDTAATVAKDMMRSFPSIRIRLMVGIGGGAPTSKHDIRLGDIVVSVPQNGRSGVLQYDFGKTMQNQEFQMTRALNQPPQNLLSAVNGLRADYESKGHPLEEEIEGAFERMPLLRETYQRPKPSSDRLYESDFIHPLHDDRSCSIVCGNATSRVKSRTKRPSGKNITIHYGQVASANQVMKDATTRDKLALINEVLCFEMEAAGLMNDFSCLIIRGICDYSDSHKNKDWQGYAAMAAAAYAKDLLNRLRPIRVESSSITPIKLESGQRAGEHQPFSANQLEMKLKSLSFEQIGARHLTIKNAHAKTCRWFIKHPTYLDWLDPSTLESHHGFLWIKGKAGSGKSTLMKFALTNAQNKMKDKKIIAFYFNARGGDLEKCTTGMYRSLLLQLLEQIPELQSILYSFPLATSIREDYKWNVQQLKSLFEEAIHSIKDEAVVCFIDALDECDEDEIRDMVSFFQSVGEFTTSHNLKFLVCFSSRHYPHISKKNALHLTLEGQEGHDQDIGNYIQSDLKIGNSKLAEDIRATVQKKSAGIFMWIILVVEILNKEYDGGRIHKLRQRLDDIPEDLHQLFRDILTRDNHHKDELLLCIQWLLYSRQPLKPQELYDALISSLEPENVDSWNIREISTDDINKFILSSSKGLAEITKSKIPTVQFIHESVKDFLLKEKGLKEICNDVGESFKKKSHDRLKQLCVQYLNFRKVPFFAGASKGRYHGYGLPKKYPFLNYAVQNVLYHANEAKMDPREQGIFFQAFNLDDWVIYNNAFEFHRVRQLDQSVTQLYVLAMHNAGNLIQHHPSRLFCFKIEESRYGLPMLAALVANSYDAVGAFLEVHARAALTDDHPKASILHQLYKEYLQDANKRKWSTKDIQFSQRKSFLSYLAGYGDVIVTSFWLHWADVDVNLPDNLGDTALIVAADKGNDDVLKLLLRHHADVKAKNTRGQLPQHKAALSGHWSTMKILLEAGADFSAKDRKNRSSLHCAVVKGHTAVIGVLLEAGADINATDGKSLLYIAAEKGDKAMVKFLLQAGADVQGRSTEDDTENESGLFIAARQGYEAIVKMLLEAGADFKRKGTAGESLLSIAASIGSEAIVKMLFEAGVHVEEQSNWVNGESVLWAAAFGRSTAVFEMLLKAGADTRVKNRKGKSLLLYTVEQGLRGILELLWKTDADICLRGENGEALLHIAAERGDGDIVRFLLNAGADVTEKLQGALPLHLATYVDYYGGWTESRYTSITELLREDAASINERDACGWTPLLRALKLFEEQNYGSWWGATIMFLIQSGADINIRAPGEQTPLHLAAEHDDEEATKLLLEAGARTEIRDKYGRTPLHRACSGMRDRQVRLLLESGANIEAKDHEGDTPLHKAVRDGESKELNSKSVELLIAHNANLRTENNDNLTPLGMAQNALPLYEKKDDSNWLRLREPEILKVINLLKAALKQPRS